jgi:hypothetical protein
LPFSLLLDTIDIRDTYNFIYKKKKNII